jgi:predicted dinucleotide-binding enzyme
MRDLRVYWQEVRALQQTLPEFVWLMSLEDAARGMTGGRMAQLGAAAAAQRLHAKSHRMATEEEIAAHLVKEDQARRQTLHDALRRRGIAVVAVPVSAIPPVADDKRAPARRR